MGDEAAEAEAGLDHGLPNGPYVSKDYQRHDIEKKAPDRSGAFCVSDRLRVQDGPFMSMICGAGSGADAGAAGRGAEAGVGAGASRRPCRTRPWK